MGARPVAVRQADIARAVRAVKSAGEFDRLRIVVEDGKLVIEARDRSAAKQERVHIVEPEEVTEF